ncbi:MAG TPA: hypothetical protein PLK85_04705 [Alphaproteobacteria bacterium]|nr:hypothetical protein [Alphaproteobacteria bacterium]
MNRKLILFRVNQGVGVTSFRVSLASFDDGVSKNLAVAMSLAKPCRVD